MVGWSFCEGLIADEQIQYRLYMMIIIIGRKLRDRELRGRELRGRKLRGRELRGRELRSREPRGRELMRGYKSYIASYHWLRY